MAKLIVRVLDTLSPEEQAIEVARQLHAHTKKQLLLPLTGEKGNVSIIDNKTEITILREAAEKPEAIHKCPVCGDGFVASVRRTLWHNYGGYPKIMRVCSEDCQSAALDQLGPRAALKKKNIGVAKFW